MEQTEAEVRKQWLVERLIGCNIFKAKDGRHLYTLTVLELEKEYERISS